MKLVILLVYPYTDLIKLLKLAVSFLYVSTQRKKGYLLNLITLLNFKGASQNVTSILLQM